MTEKPTIYLREPTVQDLELLMAWRSNPLIYKTDVAGFGKPPMWKELLDWVASYYDTKREASRLHMIIVVDPQGPAYFWRGRAVGYVLIRDWDSEIPEIGGAIGEVSLWGNDIIGEAYKLGTDIMKNRDVKKVKALTLNHNKGVENFLKNYGFTEASDDGKIKTWEKELV
jgi:RimJ/RimL family protein N-acetyltransferase